MKFILLGISFALLASGCLLLFFGIVDMLRRRATAKRLETEHQKQDDHRHAA